MAGKVWRVELRRGAVCLGRIGKVRRGFVGCGVVRPGLVWQEWIGKVRKGQSRLGKAGVVWSVLVCQGMARHVPFRQEGSGLDRLG